MTVRMGSVPDVAQQGCLAMLNFWDSYPLSITASVSQNHRGHCGLLQQAWALVRRVRNKEGVGLRAEDMRSGGAP